MEGRFSEGIYAELFDRGKGSSADDIDAWCNKVHLPDVASTQLLFHASRYRSVETEPGEPEYLNIYEVERNEALGSLRTQVMSQLWPRWQAQGRIHPALAMKRTEVWQRLGPAFTSPKSGIAPVTGLMMVQSNCSDRAHEADYHAWYNTVHVPDVLGTALYHTVYRYRAISPEAGQGEYLALYETDAPDVAEADREYRDEWRATWRKQGKLSAYHQRTARGLFRKG